MSTYISIGNSDDKLTQIRWADYAAALLGAAASAGQLHGVWYSAPTSLYQNMCVCLDVRPEQIAELKRQLFVLAVRFDQDSIAWADSPGTEFIGPAT